MNENKLIGIILVRSKSKRLPEKCFLSFGKINILEHMIKRCEFYNIKPIICTTTNKCDDKISELAKHSKIQCYRGPSKNKILRISNCCKKFNIHYFHTIDADDPFFCGKEVYRSVNYLKSYSLDIVKPTTLSSKGSGIMGFSVKSKIFHKLSKKIKKNTDTEMMWNYFYKLKKLKIKTLSKSKYDCEARLTLDYKEDYIFLETLRLLLGNFASRKSICSILKKNPGLKKINYFRNYEWKKNQMQKQKQNSQ